MPPLALTDSELDAVLAAARPLPVDRRDAFLQSVADALKRYAELGPGVVHRVCADQQRVFLTRRICRARSAPRNIARPADLHWLRANGALTRECELTREVWRNSRNVALNSRSVFWGYLSYGPARANAPVAFLWARGAGVPTTTGFAPRGRPG